MSGQHSSTYYAIQQQFNVKFPFALVAVLAIIEMLCALAIIAFEVGHDVISIYYTNLFVGFWAGIPFTILWISMFSVVCCCRQQSCATHAALQSCISLIFAGALIGINVAFLYEPNRCFFSRGICENFYRSNDLSSSINCQFNNYARNCKEARLILIGAQILAAGILFLSCIIYLILYYVVAMKTSRIEQNKKPVSAAVMAPVYYQPSPSTRNFQRQSNPYAPSAPFEIPPSQQIPLADSSKPTQYPTIYPNIGDNRF